MSVLTFGEMLLRLRAPGRERLFQRPELEATFGGAEANVAFSLSFLGMKAAYCTVLPDNLLGDACLNELRRYGVDVSRVCRGPGRLGAYYLEDGSNLLSPRMIYDREGSSLAQAGPGALDWDQVLEGVDWLHITGITPAVSASARDLCLEGAARAREKGIRVSCDLNYRRDLWNYGSAAGDVMQELLTNVNVLTASEEELEEVLGYAGPKGLPGVQRCRAAAERTLERFPGLAQVALIRRESHSADWCTWEACLCNRRGFVVSRSYEIRDMVDAVGGGDAFSAGLIYGLIRYGESKRALEFATAASALKYSVVGDFNRVTPSEVLRLMDGDVSGRDRR